MVVPVFDDSGFYNLRFSDLKRDNLSADGYQKFAGPAQVCQVVREDIVVNPYRNEDLQARPDLVCPGGGRSNDASADGVRHRIRRR
jgi:hypothetical protein